MDVIIVRVEAADVLELEVEVAVVIEAQDREAVARRRGAARVEVGAEVKLISIDRICSTTTTLLDEYNFLFYLLCISETTSHSFRF